LATIEHQYDEEDDEPDTSDVAQKETEPISVHKASEAMGTLKEFATQEGNPELLELVMQASTNMNKMLAKKMSTQPSIRHFMCVAELK